MTSSEQLRLMHLTAEMYYLEDKTQAEIAKALDISRPKVSRLLKEARGEGIVNIAISNPFERLGFLENTLKEQLGLSNVIVVSQSTKSSPHMRKRIGAAAARYLRSELQIGDTIGIGWGRSLYEVAQALEANPDRRLTTVPLMGGLGQIDPSFQVHSMAQTFSEKLGGSWSSLYAPAIVDDPVAYQALKSSPDVELISRVWSELDVAVVGIGKIDISLEIQKLFANYLGEKTIKSLKSSNAVGDICMRFFDVEGKPIPEGLQGVIAIELNELNRIPRRIGIAGGVEKANSILGAANGGYINSLITDETAAQQIIALLGINSTNQIKENNR